jgi:hypothetical protein
MSDELKITVICPDDFTEEEKQYIADRVNERLIFYSRVVYALREARLVQQIVESSLIPTPQDNPSNGEQRI